MSLLYHQHMDQTALSPTIKVTATTLVLIGILAQSGGFFLYMVVARPGEPALGTTSTSLGAMLLIVAILILVYGLLITRS